MKRLFFIVFSLILFFTFCEKEDESFDLTNKIEFTSFNVINISYRAAEVSSIIPESYGVKIDEFGHCWSLDSTPDINDTRSSFTNHTLNEFSTVLDNLMHSSTYFVKAYYRTEDIINYSKVIPFNTLKIDVPNVTTLNISNISVNNAESGGTIITINGSEIISKGICWNKKGEPTINDQFTEEGEGESQFHSNLSNLEINTTYYVRAYAKNEAGIGYGNEIIFTSNDGTPLINTLDLSEITANSAICAGDVVSDEGFTISKRGICWNTAGDPTIDDNFTNNGTGTGIFSGILTGLNPGEKYYIKAYATNEKGTTYGNEIELDFDWGTIQVEDIDGNWYNTVSIGNQVWFKENLRTTHYPDGTAINDGTGLDIENEDSPAYYFAYNDDENNVDVNGRLYTWYAATEACPDGWHMPTESDWLEMMNYIGIENAGKLKSSGTIEDGTGLWKYPNTNGTDEFGLSIFPAGQRYSTSYEYLNKRAHYLYSDRLQGFYFEYNNGECVGFIDNLSDINGYSVRCIKDK